MATLVPADCCGETNCAIITSYCGGVASFLACTVLNDCATNVESATGCTPVADQNSFNTCDVTCGTTGGVESDCIPSSQEASYSGWSCP